MSLNAAYAAYRDGSEFFDVGDVLFFATLALLSFATLAVSKDHNMKCSLTMVRFCKGKGSVHTDPILGVSHRVMATCRASPTGLTIQD